MKRYEVSRVDLSRIDISPFPPLELYRVHLELRRAGFETITEESGLAVRSWSRNPVSG